MVNKANKKKGRLERAPPSSASPPEPKEDAEAEEEFAWDETAPLEVMPEHDGYDEEDDGLDGVESKKKVRLHGGMLLVRVSPRLIGMFWGHTMRGRGAARRCRKARSSH